MLPLPPGVLRVPHLRHAHMQTASSVAHMQTECAMAHMQTERIVSLA